MRANPSWLLPAAAALVSCAWIAYGKQSAAALEHEISVLTERIRVIRSTSEVGVSAGKSAGTLDRNEDGKIDWKKIASKSESFRSSRFYFLCGTDNDTTRKMIRIQRMLLDMSAEELSAEWEEITGLDLDYSAKKQLENVFIRALALKDSRLTVERFGSSFDSQYIDSDNQLMVRNAMVKWAENDPVAATTWLDRQIADGKFESKSLDGKNRERVQLEEMLAGVLFKTDPAAVSARIAALPEDQREQISKHWFTYQLGDEKYQASYAKVLRDNLSPDQVSRIFSERACDLSRDGYEKVDKFITNANITGEETDLLVGRVMVHNLNLLGKTIAAEDLQQAREWGAAHAPGAVDKATGEALALKIARNDDFKSTSELVLHYHAQSDGDEVLASFLQNITVRSRVAAEASALIGQIKDPVLRDEIRALPQYKNQPEP